MPCELFGLDFVPSLSGQRVHSGPLPAGCSPDPAWIGSPERTASRLRSACRPGISLSRLSLSFPCPVISEPWKARTPLAGPGERGSRFTMRCQVRLASWLTSKENPSHPPSSDSDSDSDSEIALERAAKCGIVIPRPGDGHRRIRDMRAEMPARARDGSGAGLGLGNGDDHRILHWVRRLDIGKCDRCQSRNVTPGKKLSTGRRIGETQRCRAP